jgi:hypothetical protein
VSSLRSDIADAIIARLALLPDIKSASFDTVRLQANDFQDWELPAVQIIDLGEVVIHEMKRARKSWQLVVEIILGPQATTTPTQKTLWDLMETVERHLWETPNLGISGVIHMILTGTSTDLHLMQPYYLGRLEMQVDYYQPLVGTC